MARDFTDQELSRRKKLSDLQEQGKDPYVIQKFIRNYNSQTYIQEFSKFTKEELHENTTKILIAGRVMAIRQTFGVIKDFFGKVQFYVGKKSVSEEVWNTFDKSLDLGDIVGIEGTPMKTNTGEVTVKVVNLTILSKALKPLPEKFHGLTDDEERIRKRYLDLIMNEESSKTFITCSKIKNIWRELLDNQGFFEVDTGTLQPIYGGAAAKPFKTFYNSLHKDVFLRVAPELYLKKLIVGGFEKVYEFAKNFRNEGLDTTHSPEFTGFELYWAYVSLTEIMDLTEEIFHITAKKLGITKLTWRGYEIDISKPFKKISMVDAIKEGSKGEIDFTKIKTNEEAIKLAQEHGIELEKHQKTIGHIIAMFFEKYGEPICIEPTFVHTHPYETSPLAKKNPNQKGFTDRFELFICQKEFANAFSELNDPIDQLERFEAQVEESKSGASESYNDEVDWSFIDALEYGMPPTGGLGIGFDRFCMLFNQAETIRDVILFPILKDK